jgi:hypothetical protein
MIQVERALMGELPAPAVTRGWTGARLRAAEIVLGPVPRTAST